MFRVEPRVEVAMPGVSDTSLPAFKNGTPELPPWALGSLGLAAGAIALAAVLLGSPPAILLGVAAVVWILSGWAIYFRHAPRHPGMVALGSLLLFSAAAAALVVLSGLYLLFLGPSWIL